MPKILSRFNFRLRTGTKAVTALILAMVLSVSGLEYQASAATVTNGNCSATVNDSTNVSVFEGGGYCYIAFKGTSTAYQWTPPSGVTSVDLLVVAGGGGGGAMHAGGGGAGGLIQQTGFTLSGNTVNVTVGAGGAGASSAAPSNGSNGSNSVVSSTGITTQTAIGGGFGAGAAASNAGNGGSGGGRRCCDGSPGTGTVGQGNAGSNGASSGTYWIGGAGGGAGAAATAANGSTIVAGIGGAGAAVSWISTSAQTALGVGQTVSTSVYFAGGGGGGTAAQGTGGSGGSGGGGNGGTYYTAAAQAGTANTGGGGGGGGMTSSNTPMAGGAGGSGVVVFRYVAQITITYNSNGGTGTLANQSFLANQATALSANTFTKTGYTFTGWNTAANGSGTSYSNSQSVSLTSSTTLYAVWANDLMAYEPFTGTAATNIVGSAGTGSTGFTGNWTLVNATGTNGGANNSSIYTSMPTLALPTNTSFSLPASNTAASGPDWALRYSARQLSTPISFDAPGTYYYSFINHVPTVSGSWGMGMAGLLSGLPSSTTDTSPWSLLTGSPYDSVFGIDYGDANKASWMAGQTRLSANGTSAVGTKASSPTTTSTSNFVVVKIVTSASGNDQISLRAFAPSETMPTSDSSITWDVQYSAAISGTAQYAAVQTEWNGVIDEFRVGYTYQAVTGVQPVYSLTWDSNGGSTVSGASSFISGNTISEPTAPTQQGKYFGGWSTSETSNQGDVANKIASWPYTPSASNLTLYAIWYDDYSLALDGVNNVSARVGANSTSVNLVPRDNSFSWEAWIYPTGLVGTGATKWASVLDNGDSGDNYGRTWLQVKDTGSGPFLSGAYWLALNTGNAAESAANTIKLNKWQHIAMTVTRSTTDCVTQGTVYIKLYVDGVEVASANDTTSFLGCTSSSGLIVGDNWDDPNQQFKGKIDQIKIWQGALTGTEVAASRTTYSTTGVDNTLIAHYDFNDLGATPTLNAIIDNVASAATTFNLSVYGASSAAVTSSVSRSQNQFQVTYDANTATSGTTTSQTSLTPYTSLTTPGAGSLVRTGYSFGGWNTTTTGSGINFLAASTYQLLYGDQTLYSNWTANTYTVTYDYNGATGGNSSTTSSYTTGSTAITLPTPTKTGYTFAGWFESSSFTGSALGSTYSPTSTLTVYAKWTANSNTVTFNNNGGSGTMADQSITTNVATALTTNSFTKSGYAFAGWATTANGSVVYADSASVTLTAGLSLFAKWTANSNTVTFIANDGSGSPATATQSIVSDVSTALTANSFTRNGYSFSGWNTAANGSGSSYANSATVTVVANVTLYAQWTASTYTVTYNKNGATGNPERSSDVFTAGSTALTLPTIGSLAKTGYTFDGWSETNGGNKISGTYTPSASITLYARWVAASFSITYNDNSATSGSPSVTSASYTTGGTAITLATQSTMARTGYTFAGWSTTINDSSTRITNSGSYTISAPVILYALWTAVDYSVTYSTQGSTSGTAPIDPLAYNIGATAVVKANTGNLAKNGYSFAGWTTASDGSGTVYQSGSSYTIGSSNVTLYPKWTANTYTISYSGNGASGSPARTSDTYTSGDAGLSLPAVGTLVKTGYDFAGWSPSPTGSALSNNGYTTTSSLTLYAVWTLKSINYSYLRGTAGGTSLTGSHIATFPSLSAQSGLYGSVINLDTTVDATITVGADGYQFMGWNDGNSIYSRGDAFTLGSSAATFTAEWVRLYEVRYAKNGGTGVVDIDSECIQAGNTCLANQSITLHGAPNRAGYTFAGWKDQNNVSFAAGSQATITSSSYLFYAQWQAIDYTMAFNSVGGSTTSPTLTKNVDDTFSLPSPGTKTGYSFTGWFDGTNTYGVGAIYTVGTASKTFVAVWTPLVYTVSFDWNGGVGTPVSNIDYTYGTSAITLPSGSTHSRDGYVFDGWSTSQGGVAISGAFTPTGDTLLYARWADGAYTVTLNPHGGSLGQTTYTVSRGSTMTLPAPTRAGFVFDGWYEDSATTLIAGQANAVITPAATSTLHAKWVQNSLAGVNPAHINSLTSITVTGAHTWSGTHSASGTGAALSIPNGALPTGTVVKVSFIEDLSRPRSIIDNSYAYYSSVIVHWLTGTGDSASVPATAANKPLTLTLTNPAILPGAKVFMIINGVATEAAEASQSGQVTIDITQDPEFVVAATKPSLPSSVSATAVSGSQATVSWSAPASTGGAPITGYTVTASPGGATCSTTTALSCEVTGLSSGVSYSYSVVADNAIGTSGVRSTTVTYVPPVTPTAPVNVSPSNPGVPASPVVVDPVTAIKSVQTQAPAETEPPVTVAGGEAEVAEKDSAPVTQNDKVIPVSEGTSWLWFIVMSLIVLLALVFFFWRRSRSSS